ncbi:hypothetical protein [Bradyrhizobium canariense]|uniref:Uncharacterized protein n=1 Tax=Bradyrhizobium canariense TaxID=255045 RepID=A0A1X3G4B6_9BRAD|nr:hypothetical protein [Bradyrhizobium canariense]OSI76145.1 hypothetical protein BSZ22_05010 [Bradyrhizobium canariense]OSI81869.1 hypothetical protein BSZ23_04530 [Bradyrhizobium canariense]OSI95749.1 hypothetical protein BSZ25_03775 [Bradyrhizobium canariense]OSI96323.1 hypothetical protein BSZ24_04965 [Bradyrhizobium canariense]OSJ12567.1 hypothetical protein BSZ16_04390 [Bradyrhizobium canariense]
MKTPTDNPFIGELHYIPGRRQRTYYSWTDGEYVKQNQLPTLSVDGEYGTVSMLVIDPRTSQIVEQFEV